MDNVTHTLAGLLFAEGAVRLRGETASQDGLTFRTGAYVLSAVAHNLPDLDVLYAAIPDGRLGFVLQHRGYTHTLLWALMQAGLMFFITWAWARRKRWTLTRADLCWLGGLGALGALTHIVLDGTNDYGIHPFWPLDNRWFYGDAVFILEPLYWVTAAPVLLGAARGRASRWFFGLCFGSMLAACWSLSVVPWSIAAWVTIIGASSVLISRRAGPGARIVWGLGAWVVIALGFLLASGFVKQGGGAALERAFPGWQTQDLAARPLPANPLCWSLLAVQTRGDGYALRRAAFSLLPRMMPASACPSLPEQGTAPLLPVSALGSGEIQWRGEFSASLAQLRELALLHCEASAFLRFARMPYWTEARGRMVIGDLRYDRSPGLDFADFAVGSGECPAFVPPWEPPRREIAGEMP